MKKFINNTSSPRKRGSLKDELDSRVRGNDVLVLVVFFIFGFLFLTSDASACSVCFKGDPNQTANVAARAGVVMMLGVIASVLGLFAYFFISLVKRSTTHIGKAK